MDPIGRFFAAMQAASEQDMAALFADDAVYVEPFTGAVREHVGREAILATMRAGWAVPLPDMRIEVDRVDATGDTVVARWTCHSPALPGGKGSGTNVFWLVDGRIRRLETTLEAP